LDRTVFEADQTEIGDVRTILVVTGVSGCGKTTIATALVQQHVL